MSDGPASERRCGSLELLADDFEHGRSSPIWYAFTSGSGRAVPRNGRLELTLDGADAEVVYRTYVSHDLRGSELSVELLRVAGGSTGIQLFDGKGYDRFGDLIGASRGVALRVERGNLEAVRFDDAGEEVLAALDYDGALHRHLRLREQGGEVHWESSPDRAVWSTLHVEAVALDASTVFAALFARGAGPGSQAWFDRVNGPVAELLGYCTPRSLRDDFAGGALGAVWTPWNGAGTCTIEQRDGKVELDFPGAFSACALKANRLVSLREAAVSVEFDDLPRDGAFTTRVELLSLDLTDGMELDLVGQRATMRAKRGGTVAFESSIDIDPSVQRFWRLREAAGRTYWESSADGESWTTRGETDSSAQSNALAFAVWGLQTGERPLTLRFDRIAAP